MVRTSPALAARHAARAASRAPRNRVELSEVAISCQLVERLLHSGDESLFLVARLKGGVDGIDMEIIWNTRRCTIVNSEISHHLYSLFGQTVLPQLICIRTVSPAPSSCGPTTIFFMPESNGLPGSTGLIQVGRRRANQVRCHPMATKRTSRPPSSRREARDRDDSRTQSGFLAAIQGVEQQRQCGSQHAQILAATIIS